MHKRLANPRHWFVLVAGAWLFSTVPVAAQIQVDVEVLDDDGHGVKSKIRKYSDDTKLGQVLAITDAKGKGHFLCPAADLVMAEPVASVFRRSDPKNCATPLNFMVQETPETAALKAAAKAYEANGKPGHAAILYNELAQKYGSVSEEYEKFAAKAYESTAKALEVEEPTAQWAGHVVMTPELRNAVRDAQSESKVAKPDGKLNYKTLQMLVNKEAGKSLDHMVGLNQLVLDAPIRM
jgi:hypothetical protein